MTILSPTISGWRSKDGYVLKLKRGPYSKRPIGELITPDGESLSLAGARSESSADLLTRAEDAILMHRRSGRFG
jgi:hypothetical protein